MSQPATTLEAVLFESTPVALIFCNADLRVQRVNRAARHLLGDEAASGKLLTSIMSGLDEAALQAALADGRVAEMLIQSGAGESERHLNLTCAPLTIASGRGLLFTASDVTAAQLALRQSQAEAESLRARNADLQATLDHIPDVVMVIEPDGKSGYINQAGKAMRGERLADGSYPALQRPDGSPLPPAELPIARALRGENFSEAEVRYGLGERSRIFSFGGNVVQDEDGQTRNVVLVGRDITHQWQLERSLKQQRDQLQRIIDNLPDSVIVVDPQGKVVLRNQANHNLRTRVNGEPLSGERDLVAGSFYPDGRPMSLEEYPRMRAAKGEVVRDAEIHYVDEAGDKRILNVNAGPIHDDEGKIILAISVAHDITAQRRLEEEVRASRDQLQTVLDSIPNPVVLVAPGGKAIYRNPAQLQLLGMSKDRQPSTVLSSATLGVFDREGNPLGSEMYPDRRVLAGEDFSDFVYYFTGPDGLSRLMSVSGAAVRDEQGNVTLGVINSHDVSRIYNLERELRQSRDQLQTILDNMPDAVVLVGADGITRYRNRASQQLTDYDVAQVNQKHAESDLQLFTLDGRELVTDERPISRLLRGAQVSNEALLFSTSSGLHYISVSGSLLRSASGEGDMAILVTRDITEQRELEQNYKAKSDELQAILDNLSEGVTTVSSDGLRTYTNRAGLAIAGMEGGEILPETVLVDTRPRNIDGSQMTEAQYPRTRALNGEVFNDLRFILTDLRGQEKVISISGSHISAEQGRITRAITIYRDITEQRELERELKSSRDQLQAILDNMSESVVLTTSDHRVVYSNATAMRLAGADRPERFKTNSDYSVLAVRELDGTPVAAENFPTARAARGEVFNDQFSLFTDLHGVERVVTASGFHIDDDEGLLRYGVVITRDITSQYLLERSLASSRDELQAILENMTEGVILMHPDGNLSYINRAGRKMLGVDLGVDVKILGDFSQMNITYPNGLKVPLADYPLNQAAQGAVFTDSEIYYLRPDGQRLLLSVGGSAVRDEAGAVRLAINVFRDVSSQREIENQISQLLMQSDRDRQRLLTVIEQLPAGVIILSAPDLTVLARNSFANEILRLGEPEQIGEQDDTALYEMIRPDGSSLPAEQWPVNRAILGERVLGEQWRVRCQDGTMRDLLVSAVPIYEEREGEGVVFSVASTFQDISELKELDRLKDEFISITSHELRTPLTTIKGYSQMLARKLRKLDIENAARQELQKPLDTITERSERMISMVNDLLDVSRIATGRFEVVGQAIDIAALASNRSEEAEVAHQLPIQLHLPDEPVIVKGEERLVEQVLNNLIGNAAKYSPAGGAITVSVERGDEFATVSVQDEGIGIPAEQQAHLFERFYRTEKGKQTASGLGLGLYISSGIVQAHGGRMWVESAGEGKGSTFFFTLPLVQ